MNNDKELVVFLLKKWIELKSIPEKQDNRLAECNSDNIEKYIIGKSGNGNDVLQVQMIKPKSEYSISLKEILK